jgi:uncharacterized protein (UPF0335 family)
MTTISKQKSSKASLVKNQQQRPDDAQGESKLPDLFKRFLALEEEGKAVNERKAKVFDDAKVNGLEPKAVRHAFRHRVREMENPDESKKHDKLTDSYLTILRGTEGGDARNSDSAPLSPAEETAPEPHTHAHAHTRTREATTDDDGDAGGSETPSGSSPAAAPAREVHARTRANAHA